MAKKQSAKVKNIRTKARKKQTTLFSHVVSSLVTVSSHAHTGKRAPHRHTSHGILLVGLILTGILLFSNLGILRAYGASSASPTVTVNVYGAPPTEGAEITFPDTDTITDYQYVDVKGTCPDQTLVAIYRNGDFAGSSLCDTGAFTVTVQLVSGSNVLQAQNYDGVNQPGPASNQIVVTYNAPVTPTTPTGPTSTSTDVATTPQQVVKNPTPPTPTPTAPQPSENPCFNVNTQATGPASGPLISVGCIMRNIYAGETLSLPLAIKGGFAPYALSVEWGDDKKDMLTVLNSDQRTLEHTYSISGYHQIVLSATDSKGMTARTQTVVTINGTSTGAPVTPVEKITDNAKSAWVNASVPLYIAALTLALGIWVGEIIQRVAHKGKSSHNKPLHKV